MLEMKDKIIYPEGHENRPEFKILKVSLIIQVCYYLNYNNIPD
jgi:hypothetical protein